MPVKGKYHSICYVDFDSEEAANQACSIDRKIVEGKCIFVALSKPPEKHGNATIFLNNLPFNLSKEDMEKALNFCKTDIVDIRVMKSYAFVEFQNEGLMKKHLKILKNFHIKGRKIKATIADNQKQQTNVGIPVEEKEKIERNSAGTKMPQSTANKESKDEQGAECDEEGQSLGKRKPFNENASTGEITHETSKPTHQSKSNADFRKLFSFK